MLEQMIITKTTIMFVKNNHKYIIGDYQRGWWHVSEMTHKVWGGGIEQWARWRTPGCCCCVGGPSRMLNCTATLLQHLLDLLRTDSGRPIVTWVVTVAVQLFTAAQHVPCMRLHLTAPCIIIISSSSSSISGVHSGFKTLATTCFAPNYLLTFADTNHVLSLCVR